MFIGRKAELQFLENKYRQKDGQLIVLYGRRRVGKTETLRQFCKGKPHIFFSCRECTDKMQLKNFSEKLLRENIPARSYITEFSDWEKAFRAITELPYGDAKKLVVIDEFPYMCKGNPSIPSILQNLWDEILKDENVMLILCGSAMSFIEKEILAEKNPLYGRATGIYKMKEMGFYEAIQFFPNYSDRDKVLAYAILGGIPHYLKQFDSDLTLAENIKKNILSKGCTLYSEVEFLLRQELRETPLYNSIIEAVALGNTKLNEISMKSLVDDTSKTSVYLKNLIELEGGDVDGVYEYAIAPQLHEFAASVFEDICREYVREMQKANALPFRYSQMGRWWGKTTVRRKDDKREVQETEIDILAVSKHATQYLIGECKFKNKPFRYSEYLDTIAKLSPQKEKSEFYYYLFSESGFDDKILEEAANAENITLCNLSDIVEKRESEI